jgi:hypothetical protein
MLCAEHCTKFKGLHWANVGLSHFSISRANKQPMTWNSRVTKASVFVQPAHSDVSPFTVCLLHLNLYVYMYMQRVFHKELYSFQSLCKFIQRIYESCKALYETPLYVYMYIERVFHKELYSFQSFQSRCHTLRLIRLYTYPLNEFT